MATMTARARAEPEAQEGCRLGRDQVRETQSEIHKGPGFEKWRRGGKGAMSTERLEMGGQIGVGLELRGLGFLP